MSLKDYPGTDLMRARLVYWLVSKLKDFSSYAVLFCLLFYSLFEPAAK